MRTSPLHDEFEQLLLACSEGCGLHHSSIDYIAPRVNDSTGNYDDSKVWCCFHLRMRTVLTGTRMLLVVFSHIIVTLNISLLVFVYIKFVTLTYKLLIRVS